MRLMPIALAALFSMHAQAFAAGEKDDKKEKKDKSADSEYEKMRDKKYEKPEKKPLPEGEAESLSGPVILVHFNGIVNPGMGEFVISAIERAESEEAQAVLIELHTPGGLVSTTEKLIQSMLSAKVPVIVFVTPAGSHAASAGTFITLAGHIAAMSPATRIGAAHPVTGGGKDPEAEGGKHMGRKVENDLIALVEGIATERGRNVEWAIDAVRMSVSITERKALEIGVIDHIASDRKELFEKIDGTELMVGKRKVKLNVKSARVVKHEQSLRERVLNGLASPGIAMLLGLLGMIGILAEIYHPGLIIPGVMGVLCVLLSMIAMEQLPIDLGGVILIVAGVGLLVLEIYTPTYGALGVLGGIGLAIGATLLVDLENPDFAVDPSFALDLGDVAPIVVTFCAFILYIGWAVASSRKEKITTGVEGLVGTIGTVLQPVSASAGMVFVGGEYWKAKSDEPIAEKEEIEVLSVEGLSVKVRRTAQKKPADAAPTESDADTEDAV